MISTMAKHLCKHLQRLLLLLILVILALPAKAANPAQELLPVPLNSQPDHLLVIEKKRVFYNGQELLFNKECNIEQWKKLLGKPAASKQSETRLFTKTDYRWVSPEIQITCKLGRPDALPRDIELKVIFQRQVDALGKHPDDSLYYSGVLIIDGVVIDRDTTHIHYEEKRNHQQFLSRTLSAKAVKKDSQTQDTGNRISTWCKPNRTDAMIEFERNLNHADFGKLSSIKISHSLNRKIAPNCSESPYDHFISENCDRACAEKRSKASIALVKMTLPKRVGDISVDHNSDTAAIKNKSKNTSQNNEKKPRVSLSKIKSLYDKNMAVKNTNLETKVKGFYRDYTLHMNKQKEKSGIEAN